MARRVAFITGASRGTGKATALALAREEGMSCFLVSRERTTLEVAAAEVARHVGPGAVDIFPADVTDDEALGAAVGACVERFGRLDVLVINAGVNRRRHPMQADVKVWDEVLRLNLTSAMHLARFALPHITARPGGNIIFMSSLLIRRTVTEDHVGMEAYAASKAGLTAFAHTLFHSLAPYKTKVTSINFGLTATALGMRPPAHHLDFEMQDPGKMIQPEDVAASVVYACRLPHTACPLDIDLAPVGDYAAPQTTKLHAAARL